MGINVPSRQFADRQILARYIGNSMQYRFAKLGSSDDSEAVIYAAEPSVQLQDLIYPDNVVGVDQFDVNFTYLSDMLNFVLETQPDLAHVLVIKNTDCVVNSDLLVNCSAALKEVNEISSGQWALCSPSGLVDQNNQMITSYYSHMPMLPSYSEVSLIRDTLVDFYAINLRFYESIRHKLAKTKDGFELLLINEGLLANTGSFLHPKLSIAVDGEPISRDLVRVTEELSGLFESRDGLGKLSSFMGSLSEESLGMEFDAKHEREFHISMDKQFTALSAQYFRKLSLSIVTRTCFARMPYLKRLIASIIRANTNDTDIELVISTDVSDDVAQKGIGDLLSDFPQLPIVLSNNRDKQGVSRVRNLLEGIATASKEYVWIVDDDDYIATESLEILQSKMLFNQTPFLFCSSDVVKEKWFHEGNRSVLESSVASETYSAKNWIYLFSGANQIPICGFIVPREHLNNQLSKISLEQNLSEDYALILALLASVDIPRIQEVSQSLCKISVREGEDNTVNMINRRPWTSDIHGFLINLLRTDELASAGYWDLMVSRNEVESKFKNKINEQMLNEISSLNQKVRELRKSNLLLEKEVQSVRDANTQFLKMERRQAPDMQLESRKATPITAEKPESEKVTVPMENKLSSLDNVDGKEQKIQ
jgi:glycosyltransferase involved in cell wall biosynthesis